jgi:hypothetical protein
MASEDSSPAHLLQDSLETRPERPQVDLDVGAATEEWEGSPQGNVALGTEEKKTPAIPRWLLIAVILGICYWLLRLVVLGSPQSYENESMHFKYGSIGSDNLRRGIPYDIWRVLPEMFPQHLPEGKPHNYEAFGLITDMGDKQDRPIGFSKRWHLGVGDVVGLNCAFCHVSTVRRLSEGSQEIILGMPANTVNVEAFFRFLFDVSEDPQFTIEEIMARIEQRQPGLGYWQGFIQRRIVVPLFIRGLRNLKHTFSFLDRRPTPFGPGRVDTWAAYKVLALQEPVWFMEYLPEWFGPYIDMDAGPVAGLADFPALWREKVDGGALHWDGNTRAPDERNITAALGAGVTPATLDSESLKRIGRWIQSDLKPVAYHELVPNDFAGNHDQGRGKSIFENLCYDCHGETGTRIRSLEPVCLPPRAPACQADQEGAAGQSEMYIGTDPERLLAFTEELRDKLNEIRHLSVWRLEDYRKTYGYANMLLTGIWLRAPYLHNGSVPTLWHLLQKPENRPTTFCRGNNVYDWKNMGFEWEEGKTDHCKSFHYYDTRLPGNGNGGHLYGTDLSDSEKRDLIEYLKRL